MALKQVSYQSCVRRITHYFLEVARTEFNSTNIKEMWFFMVITNQNTTNQTNRTSFDGEIIEKIVDNFICINLQKALNHVPWVENRRTEFRRSRTTRFWRSRQNGDNNVEHGKQSNRGFGRGSQGVLIAKAMRSSFCTLISCL